MAHRHFDYAIKSRTFRMLGLLSRHSLTKPSPLKERTLALNIAKSADRKGFLVPINVDGLTSNDLDWLTSDITYIPFHASWARGLSQLIKLLERENCPKTSGDGRGIVKGVASQSDIVLSQPELVVSNVCAFHKLPNELFTYIVNPKLEGANFTDARRNWAFYPISPHRVIAFDLPDDDLEPIREPLLLVVRQ